MSESTNRPKTDWPAPDADGNGSGVLPDAPVPVVEPALNSLPAESSADASLLDASLFGKGPLARWQHFKRQAAKPQVRNPALAAALQIIPGAGYVYMWKWGKALLTALLFFLAYIILGLRFLQYTPAELAKRQT